MFLINLLIKIADKFVFRKGKPPLLYLTDKPEGRPPLEGA